MSGAIPRHNSKILIILALLSKTYTHHTNMAALLPTFMEPSFVPPSYRAVREDDDNDTFGMSPPPPLHRTPYERPAEVDESTMSKLDKFNSLLGFFGIIQNIRTGVFSFPKYCEWEASQETVKDTCEMITDYIILNRGWWAAMCTSDEADNVQRMWLLERLLPTMPIFDIRIFVLPLYNRWRDLNPMTASRWKKMKMFYEAYKHVLTAL